MDQLDTLRDTTNLVTPDYTNSIANIADSIIELLTGKPQDNSARTIDTSNQCNKLVLFVIDGLGSHQLQDCTDSLIAELGKAGQHTTLTTVYPSSTAAAMTSLQLGKPPASHGIVEWHTYLPEIDDIVQPFGFIDSEGNDLYEEYGITASDIASGTSIFTKLEDRGIETAAFIPAKIAGSGEYNPTDYFYTETTAHGYHTLADLTAELEETATSEGLPAFTFVYTPALDTVTHHRGPNSLNHNTQIKWIEHVLGKLSESLEDDTRIAVTADHGHIDLTDSTYTDISQVDGIMDKIDTGQNSTPLVSGLPRDIQIHTGRPGEVQQLLKQQRDNLLFLDPQECYKKGLFGPVEADQQFPDRLGDLLIIPADNSQIWKDETFAEMNGSHGGLSPEEMQVPFIMATADQLKEIC